MIALIIFYPLHDRVNEGVTQPESFLEMSLLGNISHFCLPPTDVTVTQVRVGVMEDFRKTNPAVYILESKVLSKKLIHLSKHRLDLRGEIKS